MKKNLTLSALILALLTATALAGMTKPDTMTKPADSMAKPTGEMAKPMTGHDDKMMMQAYQPYTKAAFDAAKGKQRVLFFHATWCPKCKGADTDFTKNLAMLPKDVMVFKTDYDQETDLKKMYGITRQHTFVLVDANGKALNKWVGGATKELLMNLAKKS